jgi:hypothetical protein
MRKDILANKSQSTLNRRVLHTYEDFVLTPQLHIKLFPSAPPWPAAFLPPVVGVPSIPYRSFY